jgi:DNA-binding GntR family transcriptional regulator
MFGVSKATVDKAVSELVYEGYLNRVQGKGTFVQQNLRLARTNQGNIGFKDEMLNRGKQVKTDIIDIKLIQDASLAELFSVGPTSQIVKYTRRRTIEDTVVAIQTSYVPNKFLLFTEQGLYNSVEDKELYKVLKQRGYEVSRAREIYTIDRLSNPKLITLMRANHLDPIFKVKRLSEISNGTLLEYVESYLRWDYYQIEVNLADK